ncbi:MAG: glycosyltransferase family 39 protein [Planctomycetaceae bacterium]
MWNLIKQTGNWLDEWQQKREANPFQMLLLVGLLLVVMQISPYWYATRDGAEYISVARSIGTTGEFLNYGSPRTKVPPVYPLLISPAWWTGARPWLVVSCLQAVWGLLFLGGAWLWIRRLLPQHATLLTGCMLVNTSFWFYYARTLKEVVFLALLMWTLWCLRKLVDLLQPVENKNYKLIFSWGICSTILFTLLCLTRYSAIVIAPGLFLMFLKQCWEQRSGWWQVIVVPLLVSIVPVIALYAWLRWDQQMAAIHGHGTYLAAWQEAGCSFLGRFNETLIRRTEDFGRLLLPGMFKSYSNQPTWFDWNMLIFIPTIIVVLYGWWRLFRTTNDLFVMLFPFYLMLYIAWPYQQGSRFAVTLIPLAFACYWTGCRQLLRFGPLFLSLLFLLHLMASCSYWGLVDRPRAVEDSLLWKDVDQLAAHIPSKFWMFVIRLPSIKFPQVCTRCCRWGSIIGSIRSRIIPVFTPKQTGSCSLLNSFVLSSSNEFTQQPSFNC